MGMSMYQFLLEQKRSATSRLTIKTERYLKMFFYFAPIIQWQKNCNV
jgi:hypothetical protein